MSLAAPWVDHQSLLSSAESMDALPSTVGRLATILADADHDIVDIVEAMNLDQSLTASLLRQANSAASGLRTQVSTVREAAMLMGTDALLMMAFTASLCGPMQQSLPAYGLAEGSLWKQSVAASLTTEMICKAASVAVPAEASTAALLHDFGKVVLGRHFGAPVLEMLSRAAEVDRMDLPEAERTVLGITHAEVGGLVARHWRLPEPIAEAVTRHHETGADLAPISAAVSLAHAMVPAVLAPDAEEGAAGAGDDAAADPGVTHHEVLRSLGIEPARYAEVLLSSRHRYREMAARYDVA